MKKIFLLIIIILIISGVIGYRILKEELKENLELNTKISNIIDSIDSVFTSASDSFSNIKKKSKKVTKSLIKKTGIKIKPVQAVVLHLKHGGVIAGRLLSKTENEYTIEWEGEKFKINSDRVDHVEYKTKKEIEWPYKNDVVVRRTNTIISDGEIINVDKNAITLLFLEGGGRLELDIERKDIEYLIFAPVCNTEDQLIEESLKEQFPKMKIYKEGNVTIFTDSYITTVNSYIKTIRSLYTEIYLDFFELFKDRKAKNQNFVVIFDDYTDYAENARADGVPFWAVVGYFDPMDKILYVFNSFGERIENIILDVIAGKTGKIDKFADEVKDKIDSRYHIFIEGQAKEIKDKFQEAYNFYRYELRNTTLSTLRHEFAHEVFHNWRLQDIIISKTDIDKKKMAEKKKEYLETKDYKKKEELLMELMNLRKKEIKDIQIEAAQSWLAEGIATYCGTDPIGSIDEEWLFRYQEMVRKNEINPIEFLTVFKMGSFQGLCSRGALNAYAQSWAFTVFLMRKYPNEFIAYQRRIAQKRSKSDDEDLEWLLEAVNKDLPTLEKEFREYMNTYEEVEDPQVKRFMKWYDIWDDII